MTIFGKTQQGIPEHSQVALGHGEAFSYGGLEPSWIPSMLVHLRTWTRAKVHRYRWECRGEKEEGSPRSICLHRTVVKAKAAQQVWFVHPSQCQEAC